MLKIGPDKRVPMRQVYDLYIGKLKPEDVFAAGEGGQAGQGDAQSASSSTPTCTSASSTN